MKKNEREESLGTRLKGYERDFETRIDAKDFIICRIDGHKFSKYTKGMKKPFDKILTTSMLRTTQALVEKFGASTGYTQSDEITLVFPPLYKDKLIPISFNDIDTCDTTNEYIVFDKEDNELGTIDMYFYPDEDGYHITKFHFIDSNRDMFDNAILQGRNASNEQNTKDIFSKYIIKEIVTTNEQIFGGRIQKMASLISSFTTMTFNKVFSDEITQWEAENVDAIIQKPEVRKYFDKMKEKTYDAWFDARLYGVETPEEAYNSVMWRVRDAEKNSRSMFAQTYCSHKSLLNKNGLEQVAFCKETTGKDWETIDNSLKYGFLVKKEEYLKPVDGGTMDYGQGDFVTRTRLITWADALTNFSDENVDLIVRKLK